MIGNGEIAGRWGSMLLLLILLGNGRKRSGFPWRIMVALFGLYVMDTAVWWGINIFIQHIAWAQSVRLPVMCAAFIAAYAFCYDVCAAELFYIGTVGVMIVTMAENAVRWISALCQIESQTSVCLWQVEAIRFIICTVVCVAACRVFRQFANDCLNVINKPVLFSFLLMTGGVLAGEFSLDVISDAERELIPCYMCMLMYSMVGYGAMIAALRLQRCRDELKEMKRMVENRTQYDELSRERTQLLLMTCHDLKHQIAAIRSQSGWEQFEQRLSRLEATVEEFGTTVDCGNEALNAVLTEKNTVCFKEGIRLLCMVDGVVFDFLMETEIYSLFGNALENALEAVRQITDKQKKIISLKAARKGGMAVVHVENYFEGHVSLKEGRIQTNKKGSGHGWGLRSMERIAQKYGGTVSIQTDGQMFKLTIILNPSFAPDK